MFEKAQKDQKGQKEPQHYRSATNMPTLNYKVHCMGALEKAACFSIGFIIGAAVGYLFYGGIGKDEFGKGTAATFLLNILFSGSSGTAAGLYSIRVRANQVVSKRWRKLSLQFRDMLEALNASIVAGMNIPDSFAFAYKDLLLQYEEDDFIINELQVILSGMANNVNIEELLFDFGQRSGIDDIASFANVFQVCYRKGANIKDTIRAAHEILSDKIEIRDEIETIVTANKMEQNIMSVMPVLLIGLIKFMSSDFASNFASPTGIFSTTVAVALFVAAHFIGKSVLSIKI